MQTIEVTVRSNTRRRGVAAYLSIVFGLAWLLWGVALVSTGGRAAGVALIPGMFAPAIAAVVVRRWVTREGFADAGLRPRPRQAWRTYLAALLLAPAITASIIVLAAITGVADAQLQFRSGPAGPLLALLVAIAFTPVLWGEEFGWRGYLQRRLYPGRPLRGAVMTGIIWAVWHYPVILLTGLNYPEHRMVGLALFTLFAVLMSIILGWLQQRAGSSWAPSLAHSGINYFAEPVLAAVFPGASAVILGVGGVLAIPAFAIVAVWVTATGRLGRRNDTTSQTGGRRDGSHRAVAAVPFVGDR